MPYCGVYYVFKLKNEQSQFIVKHDHSLLLNQKTTL